MEQIKNNKTISDKINKISPLWLAFKKEIDKYPNAFSIKYDIEKGYVIDLDLTFLECQQAVPNLSL